MNVLRLAGMAALLALTACTSTLSHDIKADGSVGGELVFPDKNSAKIQGGTFVASGALLALQKGATKAELYNLLGRPHFKERSGAREWDYVLNITDPFGNRRQCQFKVVFDKDKLAQSYFYRPQDCDPQSPQAQAERAQQQQAQRPSQQGAAYIPQEGDYVADFSPIDVYFGFDQHDSASLRPEERAKLIALVREYRLSHRHRMPKITLKAYTDRLGSAAYNLKLSQARAKAIQIYLQALGVPANHIQTQALGSADAKVHCAGKRSAKLRQCLSPNRRVVVITEE